MKKIVIAIVILAALTAPALAWRFGAGGGGGGCNGVINLASGCAQPMLGGL